MSLAPLLLIEDTPSLQFVYETVLKNAGHRVHCEGTGQGGMRPSACSNRALSCST